MLHFVQTNNNIFSHLKKNRQHEIPITVYLDAIYIENAFAFVKEKDIIIYLLFIKSMRNKEWSKKKRSRDIEQERTIFQESAQSKIPHKVKLLPK